MSFSISVIVTTYQRPDALNCVLASLAVQTIAPLEIIIADDGSDSITSEVIDSWRERLSYPLLHAWQEDNGFRAGGARNRAAALSSADYLVFLDGDCLVFDDFIERHTVLAEANQMVIGSRILCSPELTKKIENGVEFPLTWGKSDWLAASWQHDVNRVFPLLRLPGVSWRKLRGMRWQGVRTFNLGVWRNDFFGVNGFDEEFQGWGHEDADLAVRLIHNGVRRKDGQFALPVLHLWHRESDRRKTKDNMHRLQTRIENGQTQANIGINQYKKNPTINYSNADYQAKQPLKANT